MASSKFSTLCRSVSSANIGPKFGLLIDIDGVLVRGNQVIPNVPQTVKRLMAPDGSFRVPTVFFTNAGNCGPLDKAQQMTNALGVEVLEKHVAVSHDPLKVFKDLHQKHVLVTGQGECRALAEQMGFQNITTIGDLRKVFPMLDAIDLSRRVSEQIRGDEEFKPIEAVVLLGEPIRWESYLQYIIDLLVTDGDPRKYSLGDYPWPHIPVIACNMDLQWKFTPQIPRMGHGVFLLCLESVYRKITEKELQYRLLVGKPSGVSYKYAQRLIMNQANDLGIHGQIETLYMIGDNVNTDIFGANLHNKYLTSAVCPIIPEYCPTIDNVRQCISVLVKTGVYSEEQYEHQISHVHRDFLQYDRSYRKASYIVEDFNEGIDLIFKLENFN